MVKVEAKSAMKVAASRADIVIFGRLAHLLGFRFERVPSCFVVVQHWLLSKSLRLVQVSILVHTIMPALLRWVHGPRYHDDKPGYQEKDAILTACQY